MDDTKKRTDRKSRDVKASSRVVDMSWAAKYLDDDWENKYSTEGALDTRVARPAGDRKNEAEEDAWKEQTKVADLTSTQRLRTLNVDQAAVADSDADMKIVKEAVKDEEKVRISDAVTEETIASVEEASAEAFPEDESVRIRDALTDQTVANVEDAKAVRTTLFQMGFDEDLDEIAGLRDARSNLIAEAAASSTKKNAVSETAELGATIKLYAPVRKAVPGEGSPEDGKTKVIPRTESADKKTTEEQKASQDKTVSTEKKATTEKKTTTEKKSFIEKKATTKKKTSADKTNTSDKKKSAEKQDSVNETDPKTPGTATIVASKETRNVRKAVSETVNVEDFLTPEEPEKKKSSGRRRADATTRGKASSEREVSSDRRNSAGQRTVRQRSAYRDDYYEDRDEDRRYRNDYEEGYQYEYMPSKSPLRFIPLVLVIALCVFGFIAAREISHDVPLNSSDYSKVKYTVKEGLTDAQLAEDLESMGIIDNKLIFRIRCVFYSADYVEGTYELSPCYSTEKIINILSGYVYGTDD